MGTPLGRAATAGLGTAAALLAAWVAPPLAIAVVWPILLLVPGWALLAALQPRLDAAGRLGVAVVTSVAVSTHLVYWLSHLLGYQRPAIFLAAAVLALPIPVAAWRAPALPRLASLRAAPGGLLVAAAAAAVVGATLGVGLWRTTPDGVVAGGSNWSDLSVHLSIAETLNAGANFPPQVPYFAGVPLVYHWFADFHAAILAEAAGLFSVPAMVVQSALLSAALALVAFSLARRLLRVHAARRAAAITAALVVFGGGLGYVRLVGDLATTGRDPLELISTTSYDNQWLTGWPYFRIPSVMSTGLLVHRATTAGLPMLVAAVLLLVTALPTAAQRAAGFRDRPAVLSLAGLLGALLGPFHFFYFPAFPLLAAAWAIAGGRWRDGAAPRNAVLLLAPYLLSLPFVLTPALQAAGSASLQLMAGWESAPTDDGFAAVLFFYVTNLGVPFVLAAVALYAPFLPHRAFLAAWLVGLFAIPNVVQLSLIGFDMNKYFQAMWIAAAILTGWLVRRWPRPALAAVVVLSVPSPLLVAAWTATSNLQVLTTAEVRAAEWVRENTPSDAVFVTDGWVNSLTDPAGRMRVTGFAPYVANLGYSPDERVSHVTTIYCGGRVDLAADLMRRYGATYVVDGARPQPCLAPVDFGASDEFELVYDAGPLIWRLREP